MSAPLISAAPYRRRATVWTPGRIITRFAPAQLTSLGPRDFRGIAATDALCPQDNLSLVMSGGDLSPLDKLSWDHKVPIGSITRKTATTNQLLIEASFAPEGVDDEVDRLCAKVKAGVPMDLSLQFHVLDAEPIYPGRPERGYRATKWVAREVALVLVGADPGAKITARKARKSGVPMAANHCQTAIDEHGAFGRHHAEIADATERLDEHRSRLGTALRGLHAAVQAGDQEAAADCHARCQRCLGGIHREMKAIGDRHQDAMDALNGVGRALRSAGDVLDLGTQAEPTAGITGDPPHGRSHSADWHRRQRDLRMIDIRALEAADPRRAEIEHLRRIGESYK